MPAWSWIGFGLTAGLCAVEGFEAFMLVTAGALKGGWRRAMIAALAGLASLAPFGAGLYFAFKYINAAYIDYGIAVFIFVLGVHELMEGRAARPKRRRRPAWARIDGPLGIDPADPTSIKRFQSSHELQADGVIGPRTRGAIRSMLADGGDSQSGSTRIGVDIADEDSVRRYQRSRGLPVDGIIGPLTRGAIAADAARVLPDPADADAVRCFQRQHALAETGVVDERTQAAVRSLRSDHPAQDGHPERLAEPDVTDPESVTRFQRERALEPTGVVDHVTQGAILSERAWRRTSVGIDPAVPETINRFQHSAGVKPDGIVGPETRRAIQAARARLEDGRPSDGSPLDLDAADPASVRRFQRRHGLEETGQIDQETRNDILRELKLTGGIDITDPGAVATFQREHGLEPTGSVGAATQGALRVRQNELLSRPGGEESQRKQDGHLPAWLPVDAADDGSITAFQRDHGLQGDGVIGPRTQAALRSFLTDLTDNPPARDDGGLKSRLGGWTDVWPAYLGFTAEGFEALLFSFSVSHGRGTPFSAAAGGFAGFFFVWPFMLSKRGWIDSQPEWKVNTAIGLTLVTVATLFGLMHAFGILHS